MITLKNYDAILGKPWLYHANPYINWRTNTLTFNYGSRTINVQANTSKTKPGCHTTNTPQKRTSRKGKEKAIPLPQERKGKEQETSTTTETLLHQESSETALIETPPPRKQMAIRSKPFLLPAQHSTYNLERKDLQTNYHSNSDDTPGIIFANWMETCPPPPQIETILDKRTRRNKTEYLIKWENQPTYDATWEPAKHLNNADSKIKEFERTRTSIS
jgi:hypothetical protein